ncbi:helix-turn-helix transcriptional regulator [Streptomyces sp. UNOC14_S4]|uniref:helix-turn-helix transcriptional regulator n=1 Tax=Streptomyces sp. UNOC14_S4 TaxID=2872340 RepID=UPI001E48C6D5|nr:helix-turn-helix transcriptional regulator [Streptomyces sp. UNOC14_S4]MCC3766686.1 helix-turn-helix transcriptional regulator [Streptomyces sp. UNOC14_S4]
MPKLHTGDYELMLDLVVAVLESEDPDDVWQLVARNLHRAFPCTTVISVALRPGEGAGNTEGWAPEDIGGMLDDVVERRIREQYPLIPYVAARERAPVIVGDLCDNWRQSLWYDEARRLCGTTQQLGLPLPAGDGTLRAIVMGRDGDFGAHGIAFATRVQPLLLAADRHVRELCRLREAAAVAVAAGARKAAPDDHGLTPRERTVLGLLAEGLTSEAMGRRLAISPHTVNRHLEKVYRKLGAHSRVTAVSLARTAGLVV